MLLLFILSIELGFKQPDCLGDAILISHSVTIPKDESAWWFIVRDNLVFQLHTDNRIPFGKVSELGLMLQEEDSHRIGEYDSYSCYLIDLSKSNEEPDLAGDFCSVREMLVTNEQLFMIAGRATQVAHFIDTHRFCGRCGGKTLLVEHELAARCEDCNFQTYQRISPCIIVAIRQGRNILLARSPHHKEGYFSVLAGFVEGGETLEQAVSREVFEEVGVTVQNVEYIGSQPWPFPHSLMAGFIAKHDENQINIDDDEIAEAYWFDIDELPKVPPVATLSGRLIEETRLLIRGEE